MGLNSFFVKPIYFLKKYATIKLNGLSNNKYYNFNKNIFSVNKIQKTTKNIENNDLNFALFILFYANICINVINPILKNKYK